MLRHGAHDGVPDGLVLVIAILLAAIAGAVVLIVYFLRKSHPLLVSSARRRRVLLVCGGVALGAGFLFSLLYALSTHSAHGVARGEWAARAKGALAANPSWLDSRHPTGTTWRQFLERRAAAGKSGGGYFPVGVRGRAAFGQVALAAAVCGAFCVTAAFVNAKWIALAVFAVFLARGVVVGVPRTFTAVRIASNDAMAITMLMAYVSSQNMFHRWPHYGDEVGLVYANPKDGSGFSDLYQVGYPDKLRGEEIKLIDLTMAGARLGSAGARPKAGYYCVDITGDANGPYDYRVQCGLCAVPASYGRSGRLTFVINVTGAVHSKDTGGIPVTRWPDVAGEGWEAFARMH